MRGFEDACGSMIFNPAGHGSKVPLEFYGKHVGKSRAVLVFPS
jgi:hypothetical protein